MSKKRYYPNNWSVIKSAPDELFPTCGFDEFMEWKVAGWEIPSSIAAVIRTQNLETGKVKEYVYQNEKWARNRVSTLMDEGECDITVCTTDAIHFIYPEDLEIDDELEN